MKIIALVHDEADSSAPLLPRPPRRIEAKGRVGWMLKKLVEAGSRGVSTAELPPGLRVSHYIHLARTRHGLAIETVRESHSGAFPGSHGRYTLRSRVVILGDEQVAA